MRENNDDKLCFLFNEAQWIQLLLLDTSSWVTCNPPAISTRYFSFRQMRALAETIKDGYTPEVCICTTKRHGLTNMNCSIVTISPSIHPYAHPMSAWPISPSDSCNPIFRTPPSQLSLDDMLYFWAHHILSTSLASFRFVWCPSSTPTPFIPTRLIPSTTPLLASCLCWYFTECEVVSYVFGSKLAFSISVLANDAHALRGEGSLPAWPFSLPLGERLWPKDKKRGQWKEDILFFTRAK